jgi:hypothetical protein
VGVEALRLVFFSAAMAYGVGAAGFGLIKLVVWP